MKAYLFSWNSSDPENWDYEAAIKIFKKKGEYTVSWRTSRKNMEIGDKAFLLKLGPSPKGIIASGTITALPKKLPPPSKNLHSVAIRFDQFFDFENDEILSHEQLEEICLKLGLTQNWSPQSSGNEIKPQIVEEIDKYFNNAKTAPSIIGHNSVEPESGHTEGSSKEVVLTRYERNEDARDACLKLFGYDCSVCGINFEKTYGDIGKGFIHVHHLVPMSSIGKEYKIDHKTDLRPVCPNCHSMLHKKNPPLSIDELKKIKA